MSMHRPSTIGHPARRTSFTHDELIDRRNTAFQAAVRHSRRVYVLRRGLPIIGAGSILIVALWLWIDPLRFVRDLPSLDVGALKISGTKLTMDAPKLTGFSKDGHPYNIVAESAAQDLNKTSVIELTNVTGQFDLGERGSTVLNSKSGVYDSKTEQMRLFDGINIQSSRGYTGKMSEATGEPKKGHLVSDSPVEILFTDGNLSANRMEVFDQGKLIVFEAGVVLNLRNVEPLVGSDAEKYAEGKMVQKKK
jgi:lipopolysaccharide export system protein LptC